jgi:endogenous inhibitor of DNA gyrase (YacG/DUF329 family)
MKCPICKTLFDKEASRALPFCSPRCQEVDLGRWLGESYSVTVEKNRELDEFFDDEEPKGRHRED